MTPAPPPPRSAALREAQTWLLNLGTQTMQCTDATATTTTATDCVWSFPGAAGAPEVASVGSGALPEADTDLHPDAQSTGSLCQVNNIAVASMYSFGASFLGHSMEKIQNDFVDDFKQ